MATQQRRRSQDESEGMTDDQGRQHDSRGRFTSGGDNDNSERSTSTETARGSGTSGGKAQQAQRVISRAVRVLDEIESRISELREELEEQGHGGGRSSSRSSGSHYRAEEDEDEEVTSGGQGRVKNPATDGRLKNNRDD